MRHTSQDELFPSNYEVFVRGRSRVQPALRHRSEDDLFPKVYEAPVRRRVISKWTRGTAHTTIGFQVATRHRSKDELLPSAYEAPVTGRVVSKWRRDTSHKMISPNGYETSGYEAPVTRRVVSKSLRGTGQKENVFQVATSGYQVVTRHRSQGELFLSAGETIVSK